MIVKLILIATIVVANLQSFAQNSLKIGQQLPDLEINKILYYKSEKAKLSDFKGKLIILDFWSTGCGPCIAGMSKMDSLQKQFGNKIAILPSYCYFHSEAEKKTMDNNTVKILDSFWRSNNILSATSLPSILDNGFSKYFPVRVAYQVWIDGNRIVRAITSPEYVNEKEIQKMLDGKYPDWQVEIKEFYNGKKPFFETINNYAIKGGFHSEFSKYREGLNGFIGMIEDKVNSKSRLTAVNYNIIALYQGLVAKLTGTAKLSNSKVILETRDSSKYFKSTYLNEWLVRNSYCYEAVFSNSEGNEQVQQKMIKDLNSRLGLNARFEKRLTDCWVLKRTEAFEKPQSPIEGSDYKRIKDLVLDIQYISGIKVIDKTGIKDKIDVKIKGSDNTDQIIAQLKQQGFDLVKEKRLLEVFVITDKSFKNTI